MNIQAFTKVLLFFVFVVFYKAISNLAKFFRLHLYKTEFINLLQDKPNNINQYKLQTIKLFKNAGISDTYTPITQPTGYGHAATVNVSVFTNFPSKMAVVAQPALEMFDNAMGVYRTRVIESFSPFYWIELILFLPKSLLCYIGADLEKSAIKLCNVVFTVIWWVTCALIAIYRSQINQFLIELLGKL